MARKGYPRGFCLHCTGYCAVRARGLCITCLRRPGVKERYPCKPFGRRPKLEAPTGQKSREKDFFGELPPATEPTQTQPGTADRVEAMRLRLEAGQSLFHAGDRSEHDGVPVPSEQCSESILPGVVRERKVYKVTMGTGIRGEA